MKAIVLSFDKQAGFAELTYKKYMALWPECPFEFLIPYNDEKYPAYSFFSSQKNVTLVHSPSDIRSTIHALLDAINDDEWIYWCIDDRYPIEIKDLDALNSIVKEIVDGKLNNCNGIKLFRWREELSNDIKIISNKKFYVQEPKTLFGFWLHSFVKARILKEIFLSNELSVNYHISDITSVFHPKKRIDFFKEILVPEENIVILGEPCIEGEITKNGYKELVNYQCHIPPYKVNDQVKEFVNHNTAACRTDNEKSFVHIINPVGVSEDHPLYNIQKVTFAAIKRAWDERGDISVELITAQFNEDHPIIPSFFKKTPDLQFSVLDVNDFSKNRKLPFVMDILEKALKYSTADYVIFTNADIIPSPEFYREVNKKIIEGNTAFTINRRSVNRYPDTPDKLDEIFMQDGEAHLGHDCFIFPRTWIEKFNLGRIVVGVPWLGFSILANMACVGGGINVFQNLKLTRHLGDDQQWQSKENLEYRNFNSYEALNILAELQKQYGAFQQGGYLAQHVLLAISQVRNAGTLVNYLKNRHSFDRENGNKQKLVFSINSGRAGSEYLKTILGSAENVKSFHEPEPTMSGIFLKDAMLNPITFSYEKRFEKVKAIKEQLTHFSPSTVYAETNHMFIKTFYDVILKNFQDCDISIVILRRSLEKVLASFIKMGYYTNKNNAWSLWMHKVPSANSLLKPLKSFDDMDQYEKSIAYLIDIEMRAQDFNKRYSDQCNIVEVNLEDLQTLKQVEPFLNRLNLSSTPSTEALVGEVVNDRNKRKKDIRIDTDIDYCSKRIRDFLKEHREAGIEIPKLPQFE